MPERGYFIIDTGKYGHVAMVAVGLNTISSVVFEKPFDHLTKPVKVARGGPRCVLHMLKAGGETAFGGIAG